MKHNNFDPFASSDSPSTPSNNSTATSHLPGFGTTYNPTTTTPQIQPQNQPQNLFSNCYRPTQDYQYYQQPQPQWQQPQYQQQYQQPQYQQPQPYYQQPQPQPLPPFCTQPSTTIRPPPEASSSQPKKTRNTKPRKQDCDKASRLPWDPEEKLALAKCWIAVSEDSYISTNQKQDTFWYRVKHLFEKDWGHKKRTKDSLTGKWDNIRKYTLVFNGIYSQLQESGRASGTSDSEVQTRALTEYRVTQGDDFKHLLCWEFLRDKQKFFNPDECVVGRRNKRRDEGLTSETPFDLDEDEAEDVTRTRTRPPGRSRPQKSQKTTSSSAAGTGGSSNSSFYESINEKATELQTKKAEIMAQQFEAGLKLQRLTLSKQRNEDLGFLTQETPAHLPEAAKAIIEEQKARILEKLQNGYYDDV